MMSKKTLLAVALVLGSAVISAQASAESYFGGSVGRTNWDFDCAGATHCQKSAGSWKLYGGNDFSPYFAVEGSYIYMNEVSVNVGTVGINFNARGGDVAAVVKTPAWKGLHGFAKLGGVFMKGEIIAAVGGVSGSEAHYSAQPLVGFGGVYQLDQKLSVRLELDTRKVKISHVADTTYNVRNFSIGVQSVF
ncbi:MAG: outer membrane beta-barrel protein [Burkholderiales bacterium]|nr:outer membrane beta-barrel protein [Burkholderiales bacterium]